MTEIIENNTQSLSYESPKAEFFELELKSGIFQDMSMPDGEEMPD